MKTKQQYAHWTLLEEVEKSPAKKRRFLARCKCGVEHVVQLGNLRSGRSTQCRSCSKRGRHANNRTHGEALEKTVEWRTWRAIRQRCEKTYTASFGDYGKRGIRVCDRWQGKDGFSNFLKDMGRRPSTDHSIDRIDNAGNYTPENCRWATRTEQGRNKRNNVNLTIEGETMPVSAWSEKSSWSYATIYKRVKRGWSHKEAVFGKESDEVYFREQNRRRQQLIRKGWLTKEELKEYDELSAFVRAYVNDKHPLPFGVLEDLEEAVKELEE